MHIKRLLQRLAAQEKGAAMILMALVIMSLMASAALVTDVGVMFLNSTQIANAADAAALAGVQGLTVSPVQAEALARDYALKNGVANLTVDIKPDGRSLEVRAEKTIDLHLARVLGINTSTAAKTSKAILEPVSAVKGIAPLGVPEQEFIYGETYLLKYAGSDTPEGDYHSGWLGLLALQGPGAKLYLDDLKNGFDQEVHIDQVLNIQTGNISGNTYDGIQYRIDQCKHIPACTADSFAPDCPRVLLIPIIGSHDSQTVQVKGFAAFFVESVEGMGVENYITGKFVHYSTSGISSSTAPDNGIYVPRLSK